MNTLEILKAARAKIEKPENWTQGAFARSRIENYRTSVQDTTACAWCAQGAVESVALEAHGGIFRNAYPDYDKALATLRKHVPHGFRGLVTFNDSHKTTHENILFLFDRAIEAEEKEHSATV